MDTSEDVYSRLMSSIALDKAPLEIFCDWLHEAERYEKDHNAMAFATVDNMSRPNVRMLLVKSVTDNGIIFFTNLNSKKGQELQCNPFCSAVIHWKSLGRQVRFRGTHSLISSIESDEYFKGRHKTSKVGAMISQQSNVMISRKDFESQIDKCVQTYPENISRPPSWHGISLIPNEIEFWIEKKFRLHYRVLLTKYETQQCNQPRWNMQELYP